MCSRKPHKDRWLLSYADFITLLFATFVLMYATARAKEHVPGPVAPVARQTIAAPASPTPAALPSPLPSAAASSPVPAPPPQSNLLTELQDRLGLEKQKGLVTISTEPRGVVIALDDRMCFEQAQAEVQTAAVPMFSKVAETLSHYQNRVLLEGHTDSVPIHNGHFRSNWELSTARSIAVMELMEQQSGISKWRFLIGGSADNAPLSSNETEEGRAKNRRVDIVVLDSAPSADPAAAAHPVSFSASNAR